MLLRKKGFTIFLDFHISNGFQNRKYSDLIKHLAVTFQSVGVQLKISEEFSSIIIIYFFRI